MNENQTILVIRNPTGSMDYELFETSIFAKWWGSLTVEEVGQLMGGN
jgi:hypothetical protein